MTALCRLTRFSLRSFLAMLLLVGVAVGLLGVQIGATQRENAVLARLSKMIGPVSEVREQLVVT